MSTNSEMTIVIPTLASRERGDSLWRAIGSIRDQEYKCQIVAVVNGARRDADVVNSLEAAPDIQVLYREEGDLVQALTTGVAEVRSGLYSVLDDDDVLLPNACKCRSEYMQAHPEIDVLVTPGERRMADGSIQEIPAFDELILRDPVASALRANWLASCGGVFRRSAVGPSYYASMPRFLEWTYLALAVASTRRVAFLERNTGIHFVVHETEFSESRSEEYLLRMPENIGRLGELVLERHHKRLISQKLARANHAAANYALAQENLELAVKCHLASLREAGGLRYLSFTRHLITAMLRGQT